MASHMSYAALQSSPLWDTNASVNFSSSIKAPGPSATS